MRVLNNVLSAFLIMATFMILCSLDAHAESSEVQTYSINYDSVEEYPDGGKNIFFTLMVQKTIIMYHQQISIP